VRLTVPRRGGWHAWGGIRADFERALADPVDPAIASAEIASELRRGADYVRVTIAFTVVTTDIADALAIAWDGVKPAGISADHHVGRPRRPCPPRQKDGIEDADVLRRPLVQSCRMRTVAPRPVRDQ